MLVGVGDATRPVGAGPADSLFNVDVSAAIAPDEGVPRSRSVVFEVGSGVVDWIVPAGAPAARSVVAEVVVVVPVAALLCDSGAFVAGVLSKRQVHASVVGTPGGWRQPLALGAFRVRVPLIVVAVATSSTMGNGHYWSAPIIGSALPPVLPVIAPLMLSSPCCDPMRICPVTVLTEKASGAFVGGTALFQVSETPVSRVRLPLPCTLQTAGHCLNTPLSTGDPGMIRQVCV